MNTTNIKTQTLKVESMATIAEKSKIEANKDRTLLEVEKTKLLNLFNCKLISNELLLENLVTVNGFYSEDIIILSVFPVMNDMLIQGYNFMVNLNDKEVEIVDSEYLKNSTVHVVENEDTEEYKHLNGLAETVRLVLFEEE